MSSAIFIRTYDKDAEWLFFCLRAIKHFARGWDGVYVACPLTSVPAIYPVVKDYGIELIVTPSYPEGYLCQQISKMSADRWLRDVENILFVDSDFAFTREVAPQHFLKDGKVQLLRESYAVLGDSVPWRTITESVMKEQNLEWEYMRRLPIMHKAVTIARARKWIEDVQQMPFDHYIAFRPNREFSEFNLLGNIAEKCFPELYDLIDYDRANPEPDFGRQHWSYGGITTEQREQLDKDLL